MMDQKMFCFQCEQTAGCSGCTGAVGVCGKDATNAKLQDQLTGAMIGLARSTLGEVAPTPHTWKLLMEGLFATLTNVNFDGDTVLAHMAGIQQEKSRLMPVGNRCQDYDMEELWQADEDIRSLKSLILFGLRGMSAYAHHALMLGYSDDSVNEFFATGLLAVGSDATVGELLPVALKLGEVNLQCMALLDQANTETYGTPAPATVTMTVDKGPFIVVTGHDLRDLQLLLEQTAGKGINIYTHGEMLPAHGYPQLRQHTHLKGNIGTAWQNQKQDFANLPAPILYTTNCLMPPSPSYADRVFTTGVVTFPNTPYIGEDKDFSPLIEKAIALGGYGEDTTFHGMNGGTSMTTGFGHGTILSVADQVVAGVQSGAIRHFFLVAGCDGARSGRSYYTDFVKLTPKDTVVLTLACGKFRFNDLALGDIGGIPRLLDIGQCNDAYGAIQVAVALANVFQCGVNDLPLSYVISWYEQKAVAILLTLLHLGIQNIHLGPTLPAFVSPNVLNILVETYGISPITTPEADMKKMLGEEVSANG